MSAELTLALPIRSSTTGPKHFVSGAMPFATAQFTRRQITLGLGGYRKRDFLQYDRHNELYCWRSSHSASPAPCSTSRYLRFGNNIMR